MDMSRLASAHQLVRSHAIQARQRLRAEPGICHEGGATGMRLHPEVVRELLARLYYLKAVRYLPGMRVRSYSAAGSRSAMTRGISPSQ